MGTAVRAREYRLFTEAERTFRALVTARRFVYIKVSEGEDATPMARITKTLEKFRARALVRMPSELRTLFTHLGREAEDPWKMLRLSLRVSTLCFALALILSHDMWFQDNRLYLPSPVLSLAADAPHWLNGPL